MCSYMCLSQGRLLGYLDRIYSVKNELRAKSTLSQAASWNVEVDTFGQSPFGV